MWPVTPITHIRHIHLPGITPFHLAQAIQQNLVTKWLEYKALISSPSPPSPFPEAPNPTILTFTPTPVYTTGRREHDTLTPSQISLLKAPLYPLNPTTGKEIRQSKNPEYAPQYAEIEQTLRGGQTTFHGPGQLVVYPVIDLRTAFPKFPKGISVRCYVHLLESATIATLERWSMKGVRTENPGVWEEGGEKKIAALGVHLRRSISSYGVGLNIQTDLRWFERIVACGLVGKGVTSMWAIEEARGFSGEERFRKDRPDLLQLHGNNYQNAMCPDLVGIQWVEEFAKGLCGVHEEEKVKRQIGFLKDGELQLKDSLSG
ncbi:lipoyltransferase [Stipitochalara longipes BDJ]|nr:lipoyltransferase [Stipitochalara longipes BDJ]